MRFFVIICVGDMMEDLAALNRIPQLPIRITQARPLEQNKKTTGRDKNRGGRTIYRNTGGAHDQKCHIGHPIQQPTNYGTRAKTTTKRTDRRIPTKTARRTKEQQKSPYGDRNRKHAAMETEHPRRRLAQSGYPSANNRNPHL